MIGKSRLKKRKVSRKYDTDNDPMENTANLADVMLVFACGLMIAIVSFWDIDLDHLDERIEDHTYENIGQVFQDPETGRTFIISNDGGDNDAEQVEDGGAQ